MALQETVERAEDYGADYDDQRDGSCSGQEGVDDAPQCGMAGHRCGLSL